jgi:hypothetical protein
MTWAHREDLTVQMRLLLGRCKVIIMHTEVETLVGRENILKNESFWKPLLVLQNNGQRSVWETECGTRIRRSCAFVIASSRTIEDTTVCIFVTLFKLRGGDTQNSICG